jgi:thiol-disulfide isomerase/thioredoxin
MTPQERRLRNILVGLLAVALGSSLWAALDPQGCTSCGEARALFGGKALAFLGVAGYALLLSAALAWGPSRVLTAGLQVAALLFQKGLWCPPCLAAGTAGILALAVSFRLAPARFARTAYLLPAAALLLQAVLISSGAAGPEAESRKAAAAGRAAEEEASHIKAPSSRAHLVAFTRPDCGYCLDLERYVLPRLEAEFGDALAVTLRSAQHLPALPTPTILLSGPGGRRRFPGLPPQEELRAAILEVLGGTHESQALLPESR